MSLAHAQSEFDDAAMDDDLPEPPEALQEEAFAEFVQDSQLLADFISDEQPDYTTPFQLFHKYGGLPSMDGTGRYDNLRDSWQITMDNFFDHYRDWLGDRVMVKAREIMRAKVQAAKDEAAQAAWEDREFERNFG